MSTVYCEAVSYLLWITGIENQPWLRGAKMTPCRIIEHRIYRGLRSAPVSDEED
jgi:hypothetical protein